MANSLTLELPIQDDRDLVPDLPSGRKDNPRVDFNQTEFDTIIAQKGVRLAWSRAAICSCLGNNDQTRQPDPNCPLCQDRPGLRYFRDTAYVMRDQDRTALDGLQEYLVDRSNSPGVLIMGVLQSFSSVDKLADMIGAHRQGSALLTVPGGVVATYQDRFTMLDGIDSFREALFYDGNIEGTVDLRFPAIRIEYVTVGETVLTEGEFTLSNTGNLCLNVPPAENTLISVVYLHRPQFIVVDVLKNNRVSMNNTKVGVPITSIGNPQILPRQYRVQYEFFAPNT